MAQSYLRVKEREILQELELLEGVKHPVVKGVHLEGLLKNFLHEELPKQYSVDSGFVIGLRKLKRNGTDEESGKFRSEEMDVVIFDEQKNVNPLRLLQKRDFFIEAVHGVIAVKKNLNVSELTGKYGMLSNLMSAKAIQMHSLSLPVSNARETTDTQGGQVSLPITAVGLAFSGVKLSTIKSQLEKTAKQHSKNWAMTFPDMVVVLGKGIVYLKKQDTLGYDGEYKIIETPGNTLEEFFIRFLRLLNNRPDYFVAGLDAYRDFYA